MYSFDAVKNLASPDAGGVTANDPALVGRARVLRYCGIGKSGFQASVTKERWWEYDIAASFPASCRTTSSRRSPSPSCESSINFRRDGRRSGIVTRRNSPGFPWLVRPADAGPGEQHSWFTYCIRALGGSRDRLAHPPLRQRDLLHAAIPPASLEPDLPVSSRLPVTEQLNEEALSLPLHPGSPNRTSGRSCRTVKKFRA